MLRAGLPARLPSGRSRALAESVGVSRQTVKRRSCASVGAQPEMASSLASIRQHARVSGSTRSAPSISGDGPGDQGRRRPDQAVERRVTSHRAERRQVRLTAEAQRHFGLACVTNRCTKSRRCLRGARKGAEMPDEGKRWRPLLGDRTRPWRARCFLPYPSLSLVFQVRSERTTTLSSRN